MGKYRTRRTNVLVYVNRSLFYGSVTFPNLGLKKSTQSTMTHGEVVYSRGVYLRVKDNQSVIRLKKANE